LQEGLPEKMHRLAIKALQTFWNPNYTWSISWQNFFSTCTCLMSIPQ